MIKKLYERLVAFLRHIRIQKRFSIFFLISSFFPTLAIAFILFYQHSNTLYQNIYSIQKNTNYVNADHISDKLLKILSDSIVLSRLDSVQFLLTDYNTMDPVRVHTIQGQIIRQMNDRLIHNELKTEITFYTCDYDIVNIYGPYIHRFKPSAEQLDEMILANRENGQTIFSINAQNTLILFTPVTDNDTHEVIGFCLTRINENGISDIGSRKNPDFQTYSFIIDRNGVILVSEDDKQLMHVFPDEALITGIHSERDNIRVNYVGKEYVAVYKNVTGTDLTYVSLTPARYFRLDGLHFTVNILLMLVIWIGFSFIVSRVMTSTITRPLSQIVEEIQKRNAGDYTSRIKDIGIDELHYVSEAFNEMSDQIVLQVEDIKNAEVQKRELEIKALQAQINPHFLANTLNMIANIATVHNVSSIVKISNSLADLLRSSIQDKDRLIPVAEEMSKLQSYINIMNYRLMGKFDYEQHIEPAVEQSLIPGMILQPLVENSILHGILEDRKKRGKISVWGKSQNNRLIISVTDNGTGMDQNKINQILQGTGQSEEKGKFSSIGIHNVNERIRLMFGDEYGIDILSTIGIYTTVTVTLPIIEKE